MKLLQELTEEVQCTIEEGVNGKKNYFIEGVIMQAGIKNRNGRMYSLDVLQPEVNRYIKECVKERRAVGELGHPANGGPTIDLNRVSHIFESLKFEGNNVVGKAKILDTPSGKIVEGLLSGGMKLGVSSRGLGSLKKNSEGVQEVQNDFRLVTAADVVNDPSGPDCFVQGILESAEWIFDEKLGWKTIEIAEQEKEFVHKNYKRLDDKTKLKLFEAFLQSL